MLAPLNPTYVLRKLLFFSPRIRTTIKCLLLYLFADVRYSLLWVVLIQKRNWAIIRTIDDDDDGKSSTSNHQPEGFAYGKC
jgi:hypothetical protein